MSPTPARNKVEGEKEEEEEMQKLEIIKNEGLILVT